MTKTTESKKKKRADTQQQQVVENEDLERFASLSLQTVFNDDLREEVPKEVREEIFRGILGLCLVRGVHSFLTDLDVAGVAFENLVGHYSDMSLDFMSHALAALNEADSTDHVLTKAEQALQDFLSSRSFTSKLEKAGEVLLAKQHALHEIRRTVGRSASDFVFDNIFMSDREGTSDEDSLVKRQTEYGVVCPEHGEVPISDETYVEQLLLPEQGWRCPRCDAPSTLYNEEEDD